MRHKTAELEGALLDHAVALADGDALPNYWRDPENGTCWARPGREEWQPSSRWEQGGPIIELEQIDLTAPSTREADALWHARHCNWKTLTYSRAAGPTPLIAAMRCYVASKFGDEVELP